MGNIVMRHPGGLMGLFDDFAFPRVWGRDFDTDLPRVDIVEEKERYRLVADLPGLSEKDVEVQVGKRHLDHIGEARGGEERQGGYVFAAGTACGGIPAEFSAFG